MGESQATDGRLLAGRYRLGEVLGKGGMGTVWRAADETLGRTVAVKELRFPGNVDEDEKRRLITRTLREAKATARIRSLGAVTVYDVVEEDGRPWIVMELVEGRSLSDAIREDGPLTPGRAAEVGLIVLDVLRAAHREGILHRDVKPSNVLIGNDGRVVLSDFGIALIDGDPSVTSTGMLVGAPSYISPERARGRKPGPPADMWSLGALLYASVEGRPPYDKGSALATLTAVMTESVEPPRNAGPLTEVIYGLLAKDPEQRLDDAGVRPLLTRMVNTPAPEAVPEPEATRVIPLPVDPQPTPTDAPPAARRAAADQAKVRRALLSVRSAGTSKPGPVPTAPAAARASVTDVVSRRVMGTVAAAVVLAVVGTVIGFALANSGDTSAGAKPGASSSAAPDPAQGEGKPTGPAAPGDPSVTASTASTTEASETETEAETEEYKHSQGFEIELPSGWKHTTTGSAGARFTGPDGQKLLVGWTTSPKSDPVADWTNQEKGMRRSGYDRIGIEKVDYNGWNTADWEFSYTEGGTRFHTLDRGTVVNDGLGYGIMFTAREADWDDATTKETLRTFFDSFEPA